MGPEEVMGTRVRSHLHLLASAWAAGQGTSMTVWSLVRQGGGHHLF